jgi:hypothetical protein
MALDGTEQFHSGGVVPGANVYDFWRWAYSDLASNATRGVVAEFVVGTALGCIDRGRLEWDIADLCTAAGVHIEVRSAAYVQSWEQARPSKIRFGIRPTRGWDARTNTYAPDLKRHSHVYVFALLHHTVRETLDPLDLDQWEFHVVATAQLDAAVGPQRTITLARLVKLGAVRVPFVGLRAAVEAAAP